MLQGTSSWAGKSLLTTGLARLLARRGLSVAPFKAQNMSNNARVVDGGEIGVAQYLQALAAGVTPDVRMNPVLVKPEGDTRSQVVVLGRPDEELSALPWTERAPRLWPTIEAAYDSLRAEHELVLLEGAGSPAEINLRASDLANMRIALHAGARVVLVADIDRGGAFAHLYGTWALLRPAERGRVGGFVLNKFRGDASLLAPAPAELERLTRVPVVAVVPWLEHGLPDEDGAAEPRRRGRPRVAIVRYPTASNLDEFKGLEQVADIVWARCAEAVADAELIVLPGSKHVSGDLAWLRRVRLDVAIAEAAESGRRVLGICGGLQMLGRSLEGERGSAVSAGLGLLPHSTRFLETKLTRQRSSSFVALAGPWQALAGVGVDGYEIRHGVSDPGGLDVALPPDLGFVRDSVLAVYLHGLFENPDFVAAALGARPTRTLLDAIDELADALAPHLDLDLLLDGCRPA